MQYDPIKKSLGRVFNVTPFARKLFYAMLDILLLRAWHVKKEIAAWRKANKHLSPKVLDAGCGFGQYVFYVSGRLGTAEVTGIDVKEEQVDDCNSFFRKIGRGDRVKFLCADLTSFSAGESYDLAISVDVMEHILDDRAVFSNICRALKPGGTLIISTPSDQGGSDAHDHGEPGFIDEHVRDGYSIADITEKLHSAGFSTVSARYSYGWAGKISWKLSMKLPILALNSSKLFFVLVPFYYLMVMPFALVLNAIDLLAENSSGTGLIVTAVKPS
jgi:SAM-dependent methyltransferase